MIERTYPARDRQRHPRVLEARARPSGYIEVHVRSGWNDCTTLLLTPNEVDTLADALLSLAEEL